jgi:hypothetical protein
MNYRPGWTLLELPSVIRSRGPSLPIRVGRALELGTPWRSASLGSATSEGTLATLVVSYLVSFGSIFTLFQSHLDRESKNYMQTTFDHFISIFKSIVDQSCCINFTITSIWISMSYIFIHSYISRMAFKSN